MDMAIMEWTAYTHTTSGSVSLHIAIVHHLQQGRCLWTVENWIAVSETRGGGGAAPADEHTRPNLPLHARGLAVAPAAMPAFLPK